MQTLAIFPHHSTVAVAVAALHHSDGDGMQMSTNAGLTGKASHGHRSRETGAHIVWMANEMVAPLALCDCSILHTWYSS